MSRHKKGNDGPQPKRLNIKYDDVKCYDWTLTWAGRWNGLCLENTRQSSCMEMSTTWSELVGADSVGCSFSSKCRGCPEDKHFHEDADYEEEGLTNGSAPSIGRHLL